METLFYLSLALNLLLLGTIVGFVVSKNITPKTQKTASNKPVLTEPTSVQQEQPVQKRQPVIVNPELYHLAYQCEKQLPEGFKNRIKILVETEYPEYAAILQVDDIKISIRRNERNQSVFSAQTPLDAINIARFGYETTGRYVPVPDELKKILAMKDAVNVYLRALNLEEISENDEFWCVHTEAGCRETGWKALGWSAETAHKIFKNDFHLYKGDGQLQHCRDGQNAKVFVLLKGWEHLFTQV
ncbi:MAG: hypothetical protein E7016_05720 [Alphaproteobacteria bacterium]|nr:hypothetical protein [Alphaproteobacteria bacterium]